MNKTPIKELPTPKRRTEFQQEFGIIGDSKPIRQILETIEQVAPTDVSVLISGESGTGKELIAKAIHGKSKRRDQPLIVVNCGAIPEGIIESELFGHEKGSFTGAVSARRGYFELADRGTIFLDEIGEMPLATQVKILRILEGKEFMRVGSGEAKKVDVRVIAATNKNLSKEVQKGDFREDLYYRLNAINIRIPPLRERKEDIKLMAKKFADDFCRQDHIEFGGFTEGAYRMLEEYPWPGNVRELKNLVESIIVLEKGNPVDEYVLPKYLNQYGEMGRSLPVRVNKTSEQVEREFLYRALLELKEEIARLRELILERVFPPRRLKPWQPYPSVVYAEEEEVPPPEEEFKQTSVEEMEKELIKKTLEKVGGNKRKAAKALKISERTLYRKIKEYGLEK